MNFHYHLATTYARQDMAGHMLDWSQQPHPFKRYRHRAPLPLPRPRPPRASLASAALDPPPAGDNARIPDASDLAALALLGNGITSPGLPGLRAAASAGALYPAELYAVACGLEGLEDGVYHFSPDEPGLNSLWPASLAGATARGLGAPPAMLTLVVSMIFWRSLWKYRGRAYRYCLLDAGHVLANLELACAGLGLPFTICLDFADSSLGMILGLANQDEAPACALQVGPPPADPGPAEAALPPLDLQSLPLSGRVGRDPQVLAAHQEGELTRPGVPPAWPDHTPGQGLSPLPDPTRPEAGLLDCVRRRRSRRNFIAAALTPEVISFLLAAALPSAGPLRATILTAPASGLGGGARDYHPVAQALSRRSGESDRREAVARACLGQLWVGSAALVLVLWADLDELLQTGGPRGYRHAMLAAGRAGQRLYLAATALGLGCCGVGAYYDQELAQAAALPQEASPLYVLACGPVKGGPA